MEWYIYLWSDNYEEWQWERTPIDSRVRAIEKGLEINNGGVPFVGITNEADNPSSIFMICSNGKLFFTTDK